MERGVLKRIQTKKEEAQANNIDWKMIEIIIWKMAFGGLMLTGLLAFIATMIRLVTRGI